MSTVVLVVVAVTTQQGSSATAATAVTPLREGQSSLPHVFTFIVDDLGWGNVGYHRAAAGLVRVEQLPLCCIPATAADSAARLPHSQQPPKSPRLILTPWLRVV